MSDVVNDKDSVFNIGFYWVKLKPTQSQSNTDWQPAKFKGYMEDGDEMFVLCGNEPFYEHEDFAAIIPLLPPQ